MAQGRYTEAERAALAEQFLEDGYVVLPGLFSREKLLAWNEAFAPLLTAHIAEEGHLQNRGASRYYVTLPFEGRFADPEFFDHDDVIGIVEHLVGADGVMCQLATDTPLLGSEYQDVHRDTRALFPEVGETPPFQLAVNFPLVDVTPENGPIEIAKGTHMVSKEEGLRRIEAGEVALEPVPMRVGDVMIRDVRGLHRGTPNRTDVPRPMVVVGYSRRWYFRPEVSVTIPQATWNGLSDRAKSWLRFNPVVESLAIAPNGERYQAFAY